MNYFDFKFIHIAMIISYFYVLLTATYNPQKKSLQMLLGFFSLLLLASGIISIENLDLKEDQSYPLWLYVKALIWLGLSLFPLIVLKKTPNHAKKFNLLFLGLILFATFIVIFKPII